MNLLNRVNELRNNYDNDRQEVIRNFNAEKKSITETYKADIAKDKIAELKENSRNQVRELFSKYSENRNADIEKEEAALKNQAKPKVKEGVEFNNQLLRLTIIRDNADAVKREIEANRDDKELLRIIEDMSKGNKEVLNLLADIKSKSPEANLERAKTASIYEKMHGADLEAFIANDTSAYEL